MLNYRMEAGQRIGEDNEFREELIDIRKHAGCYLRSGGLARSSSLFRKPGRAFRCGLKS